MIRPTVHVTPPLLDPSTAHAMGIPEMDMENEYAVTLVEVPRASSYQSPAKTPPALELVRAAPKYAPA